MVPDDGFGLERLGGIRQLELNSYPLPQLELGSQYCGHAAFSEIERTSGNAGRGSGTKHSDVHRNSNRIAGNAAPDAAHAR